MTTKDRNAAVSLWVLLMGGACLVVLVIFAVMFEVHGATWLSDRLWGPK